MSVTSGDTVLINPKGKPVYEATLKLFNIFSGNYIPNGGNKTKGWYRRIMIVPFNADFNGEVEKPWIKNEFLADKNVLEYVLYKTINQKPFSRFIEPKVVKDLLKDYQEENDYILSFVKNEYIPNGWHELEAVPIFLVNSRLREYAEDMGIQKPSVYGAGKTIAKHLKDLTGNKYIVKKHRAKASDLETLDPCGFERKKLKESRDCIYKLE